MYDVVAWIWFKAHFSLRTSSCFQRTSGISWDVLVFSTAPTVDRKGFREHLECSGATMMGGWCCEKRHVDRGRHQSDIERTNHCSVLSFPFFNSIEACLLLYVVS